MEKAGTGIKRVRDACRDNGNELNFYFTDAFWMTMHSNENVPENHLNAIITLINTDTHISEYAGGFQITFFKASSKSVEKSVEKIAALIAENPYITQKELSVETGLSRRGIDKNISHMKKSGIIIRIGPAKGGHWEIINK